MLTAASFFPLNKVYRPPSGFLKKFTFIGPIDKIRNYPTVISQLETEGISFLNVEIKDTNSNQWPMRGGVKAIATIDFNLFGIFGHYSCDNTKYRYLNKVSILFRITKLVTENSK